MTRSLRDRIAELFHALEDSATRRRAQYALHIAYLFEARTADCIAVSERASAEPALESYRLGKLALACFWRGLHGQGREHLQRSEQLRVGVEAPEFWISFTHIDPVMAFHTTASNLRWILGYADQAVRHAEEAVRHARASSLHMLSACLFNVTIVRLFRREPVAAIEGARAVIAECERHDDKGWAALGLKHQLIAQSLVGGNEPETREALVGFRRIREAQREAGALLFLPFDYALETCACLRAGWHAEAREALASGMAEVQRTGNRCWEPELLRLQGELLQAESAGEAIEAATNCFRAAMDLAREQGARVLELRAALALAEARARQGAVLEALLLVEPLLVAFTEGFDTPDLCDARDWIARRASSVRGRALPDAPASPRPRPVRG